MRQRLLWGAALTVLAGSCFSQTFDPGDWTSPRLSTEVSVAATKGQNEFVVRAKVIDLRSSKVLSTPVLLVAANQPATVEIGNAEAIKLKMVFTISADGKTAAYVSEIRRNGEVESSQKATLVVAGV